MRGFLVLVLTFGLAYGAYYGYRSLIERDGAARPGLVADVKTKAAEPEEGKAAGASPGQAEVRVERTPAPEEPAGVGQVPGARKEEPDQRPLLALKRAKGLLKRGDASPTVMREAWELLSQAYLGLTDTALRDEARDLVTPIVNRYVLSRALYDEFVPTVAVKEGDTLGRLARTRGTTIEAVKRLNGLAGDTIYPGNRLKVFDKEVRIFVRKSEHRLWMTYGGLFLLEKRVGIGKDNSTPEGTFLIGTRLVDPVWYKPGEGEILPDDPRNVLGSRWLGFDDTSSGRTPIGIHGTTEEDSIGKPSSEGCIRLLNGDVAVVFDLTPRGTRVDIYE